MIVHETAIKIFITTELDMYTNNLCFLIIVISFCAIIEAQIDCDNGGTPAVNELGDDTCLCENIYTGAYCETVIEAQIDCNNGGTPAVNELGVDVCLCQNTYTGAYCETVIKAKIDCKNGGTPAVNEVGVDVCLCPNTNTGAYCETALCRFCHEEIYKNIFNDYPSHVIPAVLGSNGTKVDCAFTITNLIDIIENKEQMKVNGFFTLYWDDPRLQWNPNDFGGVQKIAVPASDVWLPDVIISNSAISFYDYSFKRDFLIEVTNDGVLKWEFGGNFLTTCDINMLNYPFDSQTCSIDIETWRYVKDDLYLSVDSIFAMPNVYGNSLWNLSSFTGIEKIIYQQYTRISFTFTWQRKPLYYHMNIIIPALMMLFASLGVYWLPYDSGEKISLAVTLLLAFSVFLIIIMDNTPTSSTNVPLITRFVILVMAVTTLSLLVAIYIAYLNGKKHSRRVPKLIRMVFFGYIARVLCMHVEEDIEKDEERIKQTENEKVKENTDDDIYVHRIHLEQHFGDSEDIVKKLDNILTILSEEEKGEKIKEEWEFLSRIIDRLFFWISFFLLIILLPLTFFHLI